ncbi:hypothetical protein RAB80_002753 [Fusarium oxysporum f. sp. vasinfectum]|nr:hypothetical protein RAB80_002753 [Fusarium oxysporum f. sp. vasinfectum]
MNIGVDRGHFNLENASKKEPDSLHKWVIPIVSVSVYLFLLVDGEEMLRNRHQGSTSSQEHSVTDNVIFPDDQRSSLFNKSVVLPTGDEEETLRHRERIFGYDEATKECDCSDERAIIDETERSVLLYL